MEKKSNAIVYGILAGTGLLIFYLTFISIFQGIEVAFLNLRNQWYYTFPLAIGFGIQIGLFTSIKHTTQITGTVAATGTFSGGSMVACCSHYLLNIIPIVGVSGLSLFLVKYQSWFLVVGIISNVIGIFIMLKHKKRMEVIDG